MRSRRQISSNSVSCSDVRVIFLRHWLFWFCLVRVLATQFCCCPPAFMANARPFDDAELANVPNSSLQAFYSNVGSTDGSILYLERVGTRSTSSMEEKFEAILAKNFRRLRQVSAHWHPFPCSYMDSPVAHTISGNHYKQDFQR